MGTKLLFMDGTFLKDLHKGILMLASSLDAYNNIFVVAVAVVPIESEDYWSWFLSNLWSSMGNILEVVTVISDREKGLIRELPLFL